ncbi:MAG: peptide ABC transporter substrate-binding protein [Phycisphaerae bacterium]|nr:peptide ABC transporter substrate-binding protein [Phycisphaerae bacterium]
MITLILVVGATLAALAWSTGQPRADFTFVGSLEPRTLDPALISWTDEFRLGRALFEGLTRLNDRSFRPEPGVAQRWDVAQDRCAYVFHLRPDARWSNGDPVVADDFVFAWRRVLTPAVASEYFYQLYPVKNARRYYESRGDGDPSNDLSFDEVGVRAIDDRTLRVELAYPCPYFLNLAAFLTLAPVHRATIERWAFRDGKVLPTKHLWTRPGNIVCNGPFVIDAWQFKRRIRLTRNLYYWDSGSIHFKTIEALPIEDVNTALLAYETGAVDMVSTVSSMAARALYEAKQAGHRPDFHTCRYFATYFYRLNCKRPPLDDVRIRQALSLTIDRDAICDRILGFGQQPAFCYVPAGSVDEMAQTDNDGKTYRYNPAKGFGQDLSPSQRVELARRLLTEAGYPDGNGLRPLELLYNRLESHHLIAQAVANRWAETLGLRVDLKQLERNVFSPRVESLDYDIARGGWIGDYTDPMTFLDMYVTDGGHNQTGFSNPEYDRLIRQATREAHPGKRFEILHRAEALLVGDQLPIAPIYEYVGYYLLNPKFGGIYPDSQLNLLMYRAFAKGTL